MRVSWAAEGPTREDFTTQTNGKSPSYNISEAQVLSWKWWCKTKKLQQQIGRFLSSPSSYLPVAYHAALLLQPLLIQLPSQHPNNVQLRFDILLRGILSRIKHSVLRNTHNSRHRSPRTIHTHEGTMPVKSVFAPINKIGPVLGSNATDVEPG